MIATILNMLIAQFYLHLLLYLFIFYFVYIFVYICSYRYFHEALFSASIVLKIKMSCTGQVFTCLSTSTLHCFPTCSLLWDANLSWLPHWIFLLSGLLLFCLRRGWPLQENIPHGCQLAFCVNEESHRAVEVPSSDGTVSSPLWTLSVRVPCCYQSQGIALSLMVFLHQLHLDKQSLY